MVQQRLDKALVKDAVHTSTNQPWMEDHGMEPAAGCRVIPGSVEDTGIDKETFPSPEDLFFIAGGNGAASGADYDGFQLFVPVPGNIHFAEIIMIAGDGKSRGSVLQ